MYLLQALTSGFAEAHDRAVLTFETPLGTRSVAGLNDRYKVSASMQQHKNLDSKTAHEVTKRVRHVRFVEPVCWIIPFHWLYF